MKSSLGSPQEINAIVRQMIEDLEAIVPMYARLHSLGLEPGRTESVHVSGGGDADQTASLAVDSDLARRRRAYARWVGGEISKAAKPLDRVRQGLERNVGPGPGYRQPQTLGSGAIVTYEQFTESLHKQAERLKEGAE